MELTPSLTPVELTLPAVFAVPKYCSNPQADGDGAKDRGLQPGGVLAEAQEEHTGLTG